MKLGDVAYDVPKGTGQVVKDGGGSLNVVVRFKAGDELSYVHKTVLSKGINVTLYFRTSRARR